MNKYIKYGIIIIIILIIMFILNKTVNSSINTQITNYLIDKGYIVSDDNNLLIKQVSEQEKLKFSLADYSLIKNVEENNDGVNYSLNAIYYYNQEHIIYSYRVTYNNSYNANFKGDYNDNNFTCEKEFSSAILSDNDKENICNLVKINLNIFNLEAKTLFTSNKIITHFKKQ